MSACQTVEGMQFDDPLRDEVDVVVIGGGIIGVCVALYLARAGQSVMLCEKGRVAAEQSSRNWGWVRQHSRDEAELPIMMESMRLWQSLSMEVGDQLGFRQHGVLYLASTEQKLAQRERWLDVARRHQLDSRLLSARQVAALTGAPEGQWQGGVMTPGDARAEPDRAVPAIARAAKRAGVQIKEGCAVRTIEQNNAEVAGVVTEHGAIKCHRVVLASGAWASLFLRNMGIDLPQLVVRSTVVRTTPVSQFFAGNAADETLAFRRREDGGYTLAQTDRTLHPIGPDSFRYLKPFLPALWRDKSSYRFERASAAHGPAAWRVARHWSADDPTPFEATRVLDPRPDPLAVDRVLKMAHAKLPGLQNASVANSWAGMIDSMPDVVPVIDTPSSAVPGVPAGLTIAAGFSGHGFGIGPAVGKLVADMVCHRAPAHDISRFRLSRFSDGSEISLGPVF